MLRRPPRLTLTDTLVPYWRRFRAQRRANLTGHQRRYRCDRPRGCVDVVIIEDQSRRFAAELERAAGDPIAADRADPSTGRGRPGKGEIGRAHVRTPVTNAHLVCRLLLAKKK